MAAISQRHFVIVLRWTARILATALVFLVLAIAIGEGPPNPFNQSAKVQLEFLCMGIMLAGLVIGWKWEGLGGVMALAGVVVFHIIEGKLWINPFFGLFTLAGILYLVCGLLSKMTVAKTT
jgi:hypothetical protein